MARVFSTAFIKAHGGATPSYTVPDGYIAVIRSITITNTNPLGIPESGSVYLGHSSCTIYQCTMSTTLDPLADQSKTIEVRVVVEATDTINVTAGSDIDITVSGYLLSTP